MKLKLIMLTMYALSMYATEPIPLQDGGNIPPKPQVTYPQDAYPRPVQKPTPPNKKSPTCLPIEENYSS